MVQPATGKLRELQLVELEMLCDFRSICEKYELQYFLDYGNLLGAVRHGGFIPWDDDIDVTMPYDDYVKFLEIAQKEFGYKYFLQTSDTDENYYRSYARIRKNNTTFMDTYQFGWDIHHGVWLDIFPLVEINPGLEYKVKKIIMQVSNFMLMDNFFNIHVDEFEKMLGKGGVKVIQIFHKIPRRKRVKMKNIFLKSIYTAKNKKGVSIAWMGLTKYYPREIYEKSCKLDFEGKKFNVPIQYKKKLEMDYGDYMKLPPKEKRNGHGGDVIIDLENNYTKYTIGNIK